MKTWLEEAGANVHHTICPIHMWLLAATQLLSCSLCQVCIGVCTHPIWCIFHSLSSAQLQGFQCFVDDHSGFGQIAADVVAELRQDYSSAPVLVFPVRPAHAAPSMAQVNASAHATKAPPPSPHTPFGPSVPISHMFCHYSKIITASTPT